MTYTIRHEHSSDIDAITHLTKVAFQNEIYSSHTEQFIVNTLRQAGKLTLSLVAVESTVIVGHVALSPVCISSGVVGWYGLGPISVWPDNQNRGIGSMLIKTALAELQQLGALGCVVLGEPSFYGRFGFKANANLQLLGVPAEYFQALCFSSELPVGEVSYHNAFNAIE